LFKKWVKILTELYPPMGRLIDKVHDVVVVGAGPAGSSCAYFLARFDMDVLLLDKATFPRDKACGDGLTPRAVNILEDMGVIDDLKSIGNWVNEVAIHAPNGGEVTASVPKWGGNPDYILIVPRLNLDDILRKAALERGAGFLGRFRVRDVQREGNIVILRGIKGRREVVVKGKVAIIATGASTGILIRMGLLDRVPPMILAARAYFDGLQGLKRQIQARMEDIPMPGYGWVFPISGVQANMGIGFWPSRWIGKHRPKSARTAFQTFVDGPSLRPMMDGAQRIGPVKGFPLRTDFGLSPTHRERILLVGEAAGLVSPLSGEGIDLALESGKIAAEHLNRVFSEGKFSERSWVDYDQLLRQRYQRSFKYLRWLRRLYVNPILADRVVQVAKHSQDLRTLLTKILLGYSDAVDGLSPKVLFRVILGR
jgi:geranylgeranyl reductase family protein